MESSPTPAPTIPKSQVSSPLSASTSNSLPVKNVPSISPTPTVKSVTSVSTTPKSALTQVTASPASKAPTPATPTASENAKKAIAPSTGASLSSQKLENEIKSTSAKSSNNATEVIIVKTVAKSAQPEMISQPVARPSTETTPMADGKSQSKNTDEPVSAPKLVTKTSAPSPAKTAQSSQQSATVNVKPKEKMQIDAACETKPAIVASGDAATRVTIAKTTVKSPQSDKTTKTNSTPSDSTVTPVISTNANSTISSTETKSKNKDAIKPVLASKPATKTSTPAPTNRKQPLPTTPAADVKSNQDSVIIAAAQAQPTTSSNSVTEITSAKTLKKSLATYTTQSTAMSSAKASSTRMDSSSNSSDAFETAKLSEKSDSKDVKKPVSESKEVTKSAPFLKIDTQPSSQAVADLRLEENSGLESCASPKPVVKSGSSVSYNLKSPSRIASPAAKSKRVEKLVTPKSPTVVVSTSIQRADKVVTVTTTGNPGGYTVATTLTTSNYGSPIVSPLSPRVRKVVVPKIATPEVRKVPVQEPLPLVRNLAKSPEFAKTVQLVETPETKRSSVSQVIKTPSVSTPKSTTVKNASAVKSSTAPAADMKSATSVSATPKSTPSAAGSNSVLTQVTTITSPKALAASTATERMKNAIAPCTVSSSSSEKSQNQIKSTSAESSSNASEVIIARTAAKSPQSETSPQPIVTPSTKAAPIMDSKSQSKNTGKSVSTSKSVTKTPALLTKNAQSSQQSATAEVTSRDASMTVVASETKAAIATSSNSATEVAFAKSSAKSPQPVQSAKTSPPPSDSTVTPVVSTNTNSTVLSTETKSKDKDPIKPVLASKPATKTSTPAPTKSTQPLPTTTTANVKSKQESAMQAMAQTQPPTSSNSGTEITAAKTLTKSPQPTKIALPASMSSAKSNSTRVDCPSNSSSASETVKPGTKSDSEDNKKPVPKPKEEAKSVPILKTNAQSLPADAKSEDESTVDTSTETKPTVHTNSTVTTSSVVATDNASKLSTVAVSTEHDEKAVTPSTLAPLSSPQVPKIMKITHSKVQRNDDLQCTKSPGHETKENTANSVDLNKIPTHIEESKNDEPSSCEHSQFPDRSEPSDIINQTKEYKYISPQTRSGPVRLSIDRVDRLQVDVPPSPSSPALVVRNSLSPRSNGRLPDEVYSPYMQDFSPVGPRVRPRSSPTVARTSSFGGPTNRPDRQDPNTRSSLGGSRTSRMRLAASNAFSPRARSRRDSALADRPESTPIWRSAGGRRMTSPNADRAESTGSRTPRNGPSTPRNSLLPGSIGSRTPGTSSGGRFSALARGARRAFGGGGVTSTPSTPLSSAVRRCLTSPAGRLMTGGGSCPSSPMLTMQEPFKLRSLERHEQAQKELVEREKRRREREKDDIKPFKARPMPDFNR